MATATANPPIYQLLVEEHGDVLAATRDAARETQRAASAALDWSDLRLDRRAVEHRRAEHRTGDGARESAWGGRTPEAGPASEGEPRAAAGHGTPEAGAPETGDDAAEARAEDGWFDRSEPSGQPEPAGH
ncbi:hypothetical protein DMH02_009655 [Streptomyces sp. WAC 00631]|uniref:hypothetical protein n=1 Tax=unclassified Streptomyces TaxID=2593676 RepID=UPI000F7B6E84|nr:MULTISPECIES: hypothetical protein [unclassified Streptomyces]MCC5033475.1 hypothetical protein [Streptomyces sp. WAC 00631]MCC9741563.1 hypothetical protein [Streptomyces sp. MNU89]